MPRLPRIDAPGLEHHVTDRGLSRRSIVRSEADVRFFLSLVAREVRDGWIQVVAYSLMTNHVHLWLRSEAGEISRVLQRVLNQHARVFNRKYGRDGPLFRGRFVSRPVRSRTYAAILLRYIDHNAVLARLAPTPWDYPHGSARHFAAPRRPPWLDASYVDGRLATLEGASNRERYARLVGTPLQAWERELVEARLRRPSAAEDRLDDLVGGLPEHVLEWLRSHALVADGPDPGLPLAPASLVLECVQEGEEAEGPWRLPTGGQRRREAVPVLRVGLLRQLSALRFSEIASRLGATASHVRTRWTQHARLVREDPLYAERAALAASRCLRTVPACRTVPVQNRLDTQDAS